MVERLPSAGGRAVSSLDTANPRSGADQSPFPWRASATTNAAQFRKRHPRPLHTPQPSAHPLPQRRSFVLRPRETCTPSCAESPSRAPRPSPPAVRSTTSRRNSPQPRRLLALHPDPAPHATIHPRPFLCCSNASLSRAGTPLTSPSARNLHHVLPLREKVQTAEQCAAPRHPRHFVFVRHSCQWRRRPRGTILTDAHAGRLCEQLAQQPAGRGKCDRS